MPIEIVDDLLKSYKLYLAVNKHIYRRQIYTIIAFSQLEEKEECKFFFIDSVYIISVLNSIILKIGNSQYKDIQRSIWHDKSYADDIIPVFESRDDAKLCFWNYQKHSCRSLIMGNSIVAKILYREKIKIIFNSKLVKELEFSFDDWLLNSYETAEFEEDLSNKFLANSSRHNLITDAFTFSYVYLDKFRGIQSQKMSLDKFFCYDFIGNSIKTPKDIHSTFKGFYGNNIYSLSCIVGKNGTGKTSIIDFLRQHFFTLLYLFDNSSEQNCSCDEDMYNNFLKDMGIQEDVKFLIIFNFKGHHYFVSNIKNINCCTDKVEKYSRGLIKKRENSKIIYFSNKIDVNSFDAYQENELKNVDSTTKGMLQSLQGYRNVDYSERKSFFNRMSSLKRTDDMQTLTHANQDLCYQLAFLSAHNDCELKQLLWDNLSKSELIISESGDKQKAFLKFIAKNITDVDLDRIEKNYLKELIYTQEAKIDFFSSGQYAKFSFLSKLYWCLKGFNDFHLFFEEILESKNEFDVQSIIQKNDTAVIFIDEGELFYHPEWQRTYINTLLNMIKENIDRVQIQILITSNSPFIISDIKSDDITYISFDDLSTLGVLTFGQNIHTLFKCNFFMDATIGEFAKKRIEFIIKQICVQDNDQYITSEIISHNVNQEFNAKTKSGDVYNYLKEIINLIGEDVYRRKLLSMLDACFGRERKLETLKEEKEKLEEQIRKLEVGEKHDSDEPI